MPYTEQQQAEFIAVFATRRRNQYLATVPVLAVLVLTLFANGRSTVFGIPMAWITAAVMVLVFGALGFSLFNWRCPACNGYLGRTLGPRFCSRCGVQLIA